MYTIYGSSRRRSYMEKVRSFVVTWESGAQLVFVVLLSCSTFLPTCGTAAPSCSYEWHASVCDIYTGGCQLYAYAHTVYEFRVSVYHVGTRSAAPTVAHGLAAAGVYPVVLAEQQPTLAPEFLEATRQTSGRMTFHNHDAYWLVSIMFTESGIATLKLSTPAYGAVPHPHCVSERTVHIPVRLESGASTHTEATVSVSQGATLKTGTVHTVRGLSVETMITVSVKDQNSDSLSRFVFWFDPFDILGPSQPHPLALPSLQATGSSPAKQARVASANQEHERLSTNNCECSNIPYMHGAVGVGPGAYLSLSCAGVTWRSAGGRSTSLATDCYEHIAHSRLPHDIYKPSLHPVCVANKQMISCSSVPGAAMDENLASLPEEFRIVSLGTSPGPTVEALVLARGIHGSTYVVFSVDRFHANSLCTLPSFVSSKGVLAPQRISCAESTGPHAEAREVELESVQSGVLGASDIVLFGSVIFVSIDAGYSFYHTWTAVEETGNIVSATVTQLGALYASTEKGTILYASSWTSAPSEIANASRWHEFQVENMSLFLYEDHMSTLQCLRAEIDQTVGELRLHHAENSCDAIRSAAVARNAAAVAAGCAEQGVSLSFSSSTGHAAVRKKYFSINNAPEHVYLNYQEEYAFQVRVHNVPVSQLEEEWITVRTSDSALISATAERSVLHAENTIIYRVTLRERGNSLQFRAPGENMERASVVVASPIIGTACAQNMGLALPAVIHVYSGCPPATTFEFDFDQSRRSTELCSDSDTNVFCTYSQAPFTPVPSVRDEVYNSKRVFLDAYSLRVIAGGYTRSTMRAFRDDELAHFNIDGKTPIVGTYSSSELGYLRAGDEVAWLCASGSPCYGLWPRLPQPSEYYVRAELATLDASTETHCSYASTVDIRIYGLPMDFFSSMQVLVSTIGIMMGVHSLAFFVWSWRQKRRRQLSEAGS